VEKAVVMHRSYLREGVLPFAEVLRTLSSYKVEGYQPYPGMVVESLDSVRWKACLVSHTFAVVRGDKDKNATATTTIGQDSRLKQSLNHGNDETEIRPVLSAVSAAFGETPLYWMQRQLLFAEKQMRFDRFHRFDFEEIDWSKWAKAWFFQWVGQRRDSKSGEWTTLKEGARDPLNGPFQRHFKKQEPGAKNALLQMATEPFEILHEINEDWFANFHQDVSCYFYLAFLGHDWLSALIAFLVQITVPVLLAVTGIQSYTLRMECDLEENEGLWGGDCINAAGTGGENWAFYCTRRTNAASWMGRTMIIAAMLIYSLKVIPAQFVRFYSSFGAVEGTMSKLLKLRQHVYDDDEDTLPTKIGYQLYTVMASIYACVAYTLNIFILYTMDSVGDILFWALAIESIKIFDLSFTRTEWYDNDYRYLKAGAFEMVIRRFVDSHELRRLGINQINGNGGNKEKEEEERWDTKVKVPLRDVATQIHEAGEVGSGLGTFSKWSLTQGDQDEADRNREMNEYTKRSKHHFYGAVNFLRRFEEECSADDTPQGTTSRLTFYGFAACVASFLRSALSLNQKSIFDKWSPKYLEGKHRQLQWNRLVYASETAYESPQGFEFLSIEKTKARLKGVEKLVTKDAWAAALAFVGDNAEERRVLEKLQKRVLYRRETENRFARNIAKVLNFSELPKQLRKASEGHWIVDTLARMLFFIVFGVLNWVSVVAQLCFPVIFLCLLTMVTTCY